MGHEVSVNGHPISPPVGQLKIPPLELVIGVRRSVVASSLPRALFPVAGPRRSADLRAGWEVLVDRLIEELEGAIDVGVHQPRMATGDSGVTASTSR